MRYIENGKIKLDGSIKECDLEEKLLKALEIIFEKGLHVDALKCYITELEKPYEYFIDQWDLHTRYSIEEDSFGDEKPTKEEYELLSEVLK